MTMVCTGSPMNALVSRRRFLQGSLVAGATLSLANGLWLETPASGRAALSAGEMTIVAALAEAMFPRGAFPIDGVEAGVPEEVDRLVSEMTEVHAAGFRYVLRGLEWGTFASRGVRFSLLSPEKRREVLDTWSAPALIARRVAGDALKAVLGMAYFSNPRVLDSIGWRAACSGGVT